MLAALVALALAAPADPPKEKEKEFTEAAKKHLDKLQGVWKAVKGVKDGVEETDAPGDGADLLIEFKGRTMLMKGNEFFEITGLDTTTDPKCIDAKTVAAAGPLPKGTVFEGIYKLDGDTLTLAVFEGGGTNRPTKFESTKGSKVILMTFERQKK
jgi:uncharacterized protein (TIGR03067 family)